jgi:hypothetical protein
LWFEVSLGKKKVNKTLTQRTSQAWWHTIPAIQKAEVGGSQPETGPRQKINILSKKITKAEQGGSVVQGCHRQ